MDRYRFGNLICKLREEQGLTQAEFAKLLDVSDKAVSKWENAQAFPRMETLEKMAEILKTSVEELFSFCRDNVKRIYFVNEYCSVLHLDIDDRLVRIKDGAWVDVDSDDITVKITGDFGLNKELDELSEEMTKLKDKLILKFGKWAFNQMMELIVQSDCTYKLQDIKDGETITVKYDAFSLGDKAMIYQDFMISYPKIVRESGEAKLIYAIAKNEREIINAYRKLGWQSDIGLDFVFMILAYPIRTLYFKHLCKPHILKKNILDVKKHRAIDEKRSKKKKHIFLKLIGALIIVFVAFFIIEPALNVEYDKPALISADYSTIELYRETYIKVSELPFDAKEYKVLGANYWYGARLDGISRFKQADSDDKVMVFEDSKGVKYLWLVQDYVDTMYTPDGEKTYNNFKTHEIYKMVEE